MRRGAHAGQVLGLVRFLHLFSGFSAVLQASIQNALRCCRLLVLVKGLFQICIPRKIMLHKNDPRFCPKNFLDKI